MKSREDARKRKFPAALVTDRKHPKGLGALGVGLEDPKRRSAAPAEMRRHAFCGAWLQGPPGALAVRCGGGRWDHLQSRRCGEKPWGSQESQSTPGHPGERAGATHSITRTSLALVPRITCLACKVQLASAPHAVTAAAPSLLVLVVRYSSDKQEKGLHSLEPILSFRTLGTHNGQTDRSIFASSNIYVKALCQEML